MKCSAHPNTDTELRCGHCDKPICPRCMIMTPGGQRCRDCARMRRPPSYEVNAVMKLRAGLAAAGVGVAGGVIWTLVPGLGLFLFLLAAGLGYVMSEAIGRVTNRKRGYVLQVIAGFGILLSYFTRNMLLRGEPVILGDLFGYLAVGVAILVAIGPLH